MASADAVPGSAPCCCMSTTEAKQLLYWCEIIVDLGCACQQLEAPVRASAVLIRRLSVPLLIRASNLQSVIFRSSCAHEVVQYVKG